MANRPNKAGRRAAAAARAADRPECEDSCQSRECGCQDEIFGGKPTPQPERAYEAMSGAQEEKANGKSTIQVFCCSMHTTEPTSTEEEHDE